MPTTFTLDQPSHVATIGSELTIIFSNSDQFGVRSLTGHVVGIQVHEVFMLVRDRIIAVSPLLLARPFTANDKDPEELWAAIAIADQHIDNDTGVIRFQAGLNSPSEWRYSRGSLFDIGLDVCNGAEFNELVEAARVALRGYGRTEEASRDIRVLPLPGKSARVVAHV